MEKCSELFTEAEVDAQLAEFCPELHASASYALDNIRVRWDYANQIMYSCHENMSVHILKRDMLKAVYAMIGNLTVTAEAMRQRL
jgi:hypothetical protein